MASYTQLYLHCVWSTWDRLPLITPLIEEPLYAVIIEKANELGCTMVAIGGIADHIHLLVRFSCTLTIAQLMAEVKGTSSHAVTHMIMPRSFFKWQRGYSAFTISKRSIPQVKTYILNQKLHHANNTLISELELNDVSNADE